MQPVPSPSIEDKGARSWTAKRAPDALLATSAAEMSHCAGPASRARDEPPRALRGAEAAATGAGDGGASRRARLQSGMRQSPTQR